MTHSRIFEYSFIFIQIIYYFDHRIDVFARVGGASYERNVSTDAMIVLHSGNIIGDNIWLWRAGEAVAHVFSNDDA